jgi:hypothetical protein
MCRVIVLDGDFECGFESFEEGGAEDVLKVGVEEGMQLD